MSKKYLITNILLFYFISFLSYSVGQSVTLIDFGNSESANSFGLDGWNQLLLSTEMGYYSGTVDGVVLNSGFLEFTDYMGVKGSERSFSLGERVVVTWHNTSDETIYFTSRISFDDTDVPNGGAVEGNWFTMRSFNDYRETLVELAPGETGRTSFNITDKGVHKCDGNYSLVNINIAVEWGQSNYKQYIICDKIELYNDVSVVNPSAPINLTATSLSDSKIYLEWEMPLDGGGGVVEYLIYNGDKVEGYSRENNYTVVFLEPENSYDFSVTALDRNRNESLKSETISIKTKKYNHNNSLINPSGFNYRGAFALPESFTWGGEGIAYNQNGNPEASDNFIGSLFATNLNQPENGLVGEVTIPMPIISAGKNLNELNEASVIQEPANIRPENINNWDFVDIWRTGLEYLPNENMLYSSWSIHYTVSGEKHSTISRCSADDLANSEKEGAWYLGESTELPNEAMMCDYLFSIPVDETASIISSRLVTGRFRDGGLSGLGPTMYSFSPIGNTSLPPNSILDFNAILEYGSVEGTNNYDYPNSIDGYKHSDVWRDAAYISKNDQAAFMVIGNKALGDNWYGYKGENMLHQWVAYDIPYPDFYATDPNGKSWMSHEFVPMVIFFDPADIIAVANGTMESYAPQPYAALRIDNNIFYGDAKEIRSAAYDSERGILYTAEFDVERDGWIIIHTWQIDNVVDVEPIKQIPQKFGLEQNFPNPFNPSTIITFNLAVNSYVTLKVFNLLGQEIAVLLNENKTAGFHQVKFDASKLASGTYLYQLKSENNIATKKMMILK